MVAAATTPREERRLSNLSRIACDAAGHTSEVPALFIIGSVVSLYVAGTPAAPIDGAALPLPSMRPDTPGLPAKVVTTPSGLTRRMVWLSASAT